MQRSIVRMEKLAKISKFVYLNLNYAETEELREAESRLSLSDREQLAMLD